MTDQQIDNAIKGSIPVVLWYGLTWFGRAPGMELLEFVLWQLLTIAVLAGLVLVGHLTRPGPLAKLWFSLALMMTWMGGSAFPVFAKGARTILVYCAFIGGFWLLALVVAVVLTICSRLSGQKR